MADLSTKEERLLKLAEKGGNDASLLLLDIVNELEDKMSEMEKKHKEEMEAMKEKMPEMSDEEKIEDVATRLMVKLAVLEKGDVGEKGDKGDQGEPGIPGKDGIDGINGVNGLNGRDGLDGLPGKDGKDGSPDSPEQVRDKLETLKGKERLDVSAIDGLDEKLKSVEGTGTTIFGPGKTKVYLKDLSAQLDGVTKTFNIGSHFGITGVWTSSAPFSYRPTIDYVESGKNIVFDASIDASISLATGQTLIVQYLK